MNSGRLFTSLKIIIWNAIVNENNKDYYLSGTRSYQDHLRISKNSLLIDDYSSRVAALPVEVAFITCITVVQKIFMDGHVIGE